MLLPNLWLGPLAAAKDAEFLRREKIGLVIGVRAAGRKLPGAPTGPVGAEGMTLEEQACAPRYVTVDVHSGPGLLSGIESAAEMIDRETLRNLNGGMADPLAMKHNVARLLLGLSDQSISAAETQSMSRTLLYCETGNERSAAVAVGYVMHIFDVDTVRAVQFVQSRRFCISFSEEVKGCLVTYEGVVRARRMVEAQKPSISNGGEMEIERGRGRKRGVYDEDEDDGMDGRSGIAPFVDPASQPKDGDFEMEM